MRGRSRFASGAVSLSIVAAITTLSCAFKAEEFRYCQETSFCRRHRKFDGQNSLATYFLHGAQQLEDGSVSGELKNELNPGKSLTLQVFPLNDGVFRIKIDEMGAAVKRYEVQDVLIADPKSRLSHAQWTVHGSTARLVNGERALVIKLAPERFEAHLELGGLKIIALNARNLLKWEVLKDKSAEGALEDVTGDNEGLWEESFRSHRDSKPRGPTSVGLDVDFVGAPHVYGLPERASSFALPVTRGEGAARDEPYRLYNLDVFEYDVTPDRAHQPLYGAVPLLLSHRREASAGLLWLNGAETYVDVEADPAGPAGPAAGGGRRTHWFSESGVADLFLLSAGAGAGPAGGGPAGVQAQYARLVGTQFLPPLFALGYHQCRWNYKDEADVREVDGKFDEHDMPYDVLWLDIEHTVGKRYMTWDRHLFPDPEGLQRDLASRGRKMVTIIDPHLKADADYPVYNDAKHKGYFVQTPQGSNFEGHCWPGTSSWLDYLSPAVRDYWAARFLTTNYVGSTEHLYTWNDMNEPSVFNGPEVTMQKDLVHHGGVEHRDVHNLYGFYMTMATAAGHALLRPNRRPFILSRAFFAGSQRYAAVWTGDNMARWEHLAAATPMLLQLSVAGIHFCGADVGGFFFNPDTELLVRWYQAAAYTPFFRGHAHIDTKRREPWLFGEPHTSRIRSALRARYAILPYLYTLFRDAHTKGQPILRPLWMEFPSDEATFGIDSAFMLGPALLVAPVAAAGASTAPVYLPSAAPGGGAHDAAAAAGAGAGADVWYPFRGGPAARTGLFQALWQRLQGASPTGIALKGGQTVTAEAGLDYGAPVFQRGGTIVPTRERARRSTAAMAHDPLTLHVALSAAGAAAGEVYLDDGDTDRHAAGEFALYSLSFAGGALRLTLSAGRRPDAVGPAGPVGVERIVLYGVPRRPAEARTGDGAAVEMTYDAEAQVLLLRKPGVHLGADWTIRLA